MMIVTFAAQDSSKVTAVDSASAQTAQPAGEEIRTPQNGQFTVIAYTVAGVIYLSYLLLLRQRWSALRKRQANAAQSRR